MANPILELQVSTRDLPTRENLPPDDANTGPEMSFLTGELTRQKFAVSGVPRLQRQDKQEIHGIQTATRLKNKAVYLRLYAKAPKPLEPHPSDLLSPTLTLKNLPF